LNAIDSLGERYRFIADQWVACDRGEFEDDVIVHGAKAGSEEDKYYLLKVNFDSFRRWT